MNSDQVNKLNEEVALLNQKLLLANKEIEKKNLIIIGLLKDKQKLNKQFNRSVK